MYEHNDKQVRPEQLEKRGLVTDVVVPIAETVAGTATGVWVGNKLAGKQPPPPPEKD